MSQFLYQIMMKILPASCSALHQLASAACSDYEPRTVEAVSVSRKLSLNNDKRWLVVLHRVSRQHMDATKWKHHVQNWHVTKARKCKPRQMNARFQVDFVVCFAFSAIGRRGSNCATYNSMHQNHRIWELIYKYTDTCHVPKSVEGCLRINNWLKDSI